MTSNVLTADASAPARQRNRLEELSRSPYFEEVVAANRLYLAAAVADPLGTEQERWAMSCLPATNANDRFSTVSMRKMETFVLLKPRGVGPECFVIVSRTVLESYGEAFDDRGLKILSSSYQAAGMISFTSREAGAAWPGR